MNDRSNRFCYLFGSFNDRLQLKNENSDVDVLCNGVSENEIRQLLIDKFGKKMQSVKIDHKQAIFREKIIFPIMCYWQKCEFFELYNEQAVQYKFNCGSKFVHNFGAHLRHPDRTIFANYIKQKTILNISTGFDFDKSIKHYGELNYQNELQKIGTSEIKFLNEIRKRGWKVNKHCSQLLGGSFDIDSESKEIISATNKKMSYEDFIKKCY